MAIFDTIRKHDMFFCGFLFSTHRFVPKPTHYLFITMYLQNIKYINNCL